MKKSNLILSALIASSAFLSSTNTLALGYQSSTDAPSGGREDELHGVQATTEAGDCAAAPGGGTFCDTSFSNDSEFQAFFLVDNKSPCVAIGALGGACRNLGAGVGSNTQNVIDTYAGGAFETADGNTPTVPYGSVFLPDCPETLAGGACFRETPLTSTFYSWNFTTDESGKITDGFIITDSNFGSGGATIGVFIWPEMIFRSYRGTGSDGFGSLADRDCAASATSDYTTCYNGLPSTETGPSSESQFDYVTVPMKDQTSGKAVPMPAMAAVALGLGLIGITFLTGRRRSIK